VIDALDIQLAPMDQRLRAFARHQPGCKALLSQFGVGELTAVTILAELGDARRFSSSSEAVRFAGLDITVHQSDQRRALDTFRARAHRRCGGRCLKRRCAPRADAALTMSITPRLPSAWAPTARGCRSRARSLGAAITCCENSATRRSPRSDPRSVRVTLSVTQMHRGQLHARSCRHDPIVDGPYRPSGRTAYPRGVAPPTIMSPARSHPGPSTQIRLSARAHPTHITHPAHGPPESNDGLAMTRRHR
jgi:hypothetical protein